MRKVFVYLCHRIGERSTLGDIAAAIAFAAALPSPWNIAAFFVLLGKALIPDGPAPGTGK